MTVEETQLVVAWVSFLRTPVNILCSFFLAFSSSKVGSKALCVDIGTAAYLVLAFLLSASPKTLFVNVVALGVCLFAPHFALPSKYLRPAARRCMCMCGPLAVMWPSSAGHDTCEWRYNGFVRSLTDPLVVSSYAYILCGVFILVAFPSQLHLGCMECVAGVGSCIYHRAREGAFLNLDATMATALLVVTVWSWLVSLYIGDYVFAGVMFFGLCVGYRLLMDCGAPAEIITSTKSGYVRRSRALPGEYDGIHVFWHMTSAVGPVLAALFLEYDTPAAWTGPCGAGYLDEYETVPTMPALALAMGVAGSIYSNTYAGMPWD